MKIKLQNKPIYEKLIEHLTDRIKSGVYQEGSRLPTEAELCKEFQVSRNCVREAIKCLSAGGLVVSSAGKGSFLAPDARKTLLKRGMILDFGNYSSLSELLELRLIIEPEAAALAAQKASPEQQKKLKVLLDNLKISFEQKENWVKPGLESHNLIAEMTGNAYLIKVLSFISEELHMSRTYLYKKYLLYDEMWQEHQNIYQAICDRDPERARNFMRIHIEHSREIYLA